MKINRLPLSPSAPSQGSHLTFVGKAMTVAAIAAGLVLAWRLAEVFVLVFGSIVFAAGLRGIAHLAQRRLKVPARFSVLASVLFVALVLGAVGALIGDAVGEQMVSLRERLPLALRSLQEWLNQTPFGRQAVQAAQNINLSELPVSVPKLASAAGLTLGAVGSGLLMVILAIYLAADPHLYLRGLLLLCPPHRRPAIEAALAHAGQGVTRWLQGQLISMAFLGATTMAGLFLIGAPLAMTLGLITGLLCFVPFIGAVVAGVLSVLVAFTDGPQTALYVGILFLAIQQLEEYLVTPFVQRRAVSLPPAVTLISAVAVGVLLGPLGVVFATPLTVVVMFLVNDLYVNALSAASSSSSSSPPAALPQAAPAATGSTDGQAQPSGLR